jgi:hypothetical protein
VHSRRTVPTQRSAKAFAFGDLGGCEGDLHARAGEDGVEGVGELPIPVAQEEPEPVQLVEVHHQVPHLLGGPVLVQVCGDAEDVHSARCDFHDEQEVQPSVVRGVDVEEVAGQQARGLGA